MAIRLAKLARQLKRQPIEILGLLHAIGYDRYRSSNDQVSDAAVARLEKAIRDGVKPVQLEVAERPAAPSRRAQKAQQDAGASDMMSALMPGVTPLRKAASTPRAAAPTRVMASEPVVASAPEAPAEVLPAASGDEPEPAQSSRAEEELMVLAARLASAEAESSDLRRRLAEVEQPLSVKDLLERRGLRGRDEMERVLQALAEKRLLLDVLGAAHLPDSRPVEQLLASRVLLVESGVPDGLPESLVSVAVGPERSELGSPAELDAAIGRVSEVMMLHGKTHLAVLGGPALQVHLLRRNLDSRLVWLNAMTEITDAARTVVVCWGPEASLPGAAAPEEVVVVSATGGLPELARALNLGLESDQ